MTLVIAPKKVALILITLAVSLTLISIVSQFLLHAIGSQLLPSQYQYKLLFHFRRLFDVYGEGNVPTFFSALLLFSGSVLLTIVAFAKKNGRYFAHWLGLAAIFLFLSLDESSHIHESMELGMRKLFDASGFFYYAWVIPYSVFAAAVFVLYLSFLQHLPPATKILFFAADLIYVGGAIGLEMAAGKYEDVTHISADRVHIALASVEELMEMTGTIIFIYAVLSYLETEVGSLSIKIASFKKPI